MSKTINSFVYLPSGVINILNSEFPKNNPDRNYAIRFIDNLIKRSYRDTGMIDSFIETSKTYFRQGFNVRYLSWLNKLINSGIISVNNSYYSDKTNSNNSYSKSYSINSITPSHTILWLGFDQTHYKPVSYSVKINENSKAEIRMQNIVKEDLKNIKMDWKKLLSLAYSEIEKVSIKMYRVNEEIERDGMYVTYRDWSKEHRYWMKKEIAIAKANELGRLLIEDENRYYISDEHEFILRKKSAMYQSYQTSILRMEKGMFYGSRNTTNNRLDTNLTNLSKLLTDEICKENNLVQFDLANSQFAILSDVLDSKLDSADFKLFQKEAYNGTLYEYLMNTLNISDRNNSKKMMFELMFSKEGNKGVLKKKLASTFPTLVAYVDTYKANHGYKEFSVMLQKREAEIFIDGLYTQIKKNKLFCLTKHDSLIVRKQDEYIVENLIKEYFNKINFNGKITKT